MPCPCFLLVCPGGGWDGDGHWGGGDDGSGSGCCRWCAVVVIVVTVGGVVAPSLDAQPLPRACMS